MKKILVFALMLTVVQLGAQNKEAEAVLKAYEKAKTDVTGKKAQDAASWVRFGNSIAAVYDHPAKNVWVGLSAVEARVLLKDQRSTGSESKTINGEAYNVMHYSDKDLFFDANGSLAFWVVTHPLLPQDLLNEAFDAYQKAYELDAKGSQKKAISEGISKLKDHYISEAMSANSIGNYTLSSKSFGSSIRCGEHPTVNKLDTIVVFYTGLTAFYAQEYERSINYIQRALTLGYAQDGAAYSFLAESYKAIGQTDKVELTLAEGFTKYPSNQGILVSLINMYMENDDDPAKLMDYIHKARENEPNNESLYYAEGNVWKKLNNMDKAIEFYEKSVEINPNYLIGYISIGTTYYDAAVEVQNAASDEMDDRKYNALIDEMDKLLMKAVEPLEKSFSLTDNADYRVDIANYLKFIYYRLQGKDEAYTPLYEKYRDISENR